MPHTFGTGVTCENFCRQSQDLEGFVVVQTHFQHLVRTPPAVLGLNLMVHFSAIADMCALVSCVFASHVIVSMTSGELKCLHMFISISCSAVHGMRELSMNSQAGLREHNPSSGPPVCISIQKHRQRHDPHHPSLSNNQRQTRAIIPTSSASQKKNLHVTETQTRQVLSETIDISLEHHECRAKTTAIFAVTPSGFRLASSVGTLMMIGG